MADIVENEEIDRDTIEQEVLEQQFNKKYKLLAETVVSLKKSYIHKLHGTYSQKIAVSLSDHSIEVYQLTNSSLKKVCRLSGHSRGVTELVFCPKEDHILYSTGYDRTVKMWDTRAGGTCAQEFKDDEGQLSRQYECMDVSCNGRVLCAGSQLIEDDAYLVFWDNRNPSPLGGYWDSHTDDITQVKFHRQKPEILASGSLDGLLNIFNILESTEDDALTYSLNIENSVEKITWLDEKHVGCITQSNDLQLWDVESGDMVKSFTRDKVARCIKRSRDDDCYLVDVYPSCDDTPVLLAGSYGGNGTVLRAVTISDKKLQPRTDFTQNKQIVRCCWYDHTRDILVTGGESGAISVWAGDGADVTGDGADDTGAVGARAGTGDVAKRAGGTILHASRHKPY